MSFPIKMAGTVNTEAISTSSFELQTALRARRKQSERDSLILEHIKKQEQLRIVPSDFKQGLEWINTTSSLSLKKQLQGKIVVLDFFTYCCINCMHILPDLEDLEKQYSDQDGLAIVGVHSAKFQNEKTSSNILSAVLRYNIKHPVVNDHEALMWNELNIACWPTLLILGPDSEILHTIVGEGHREELIEFVRVAVQFYKSEGKIKDHAIGISPLASSSFHNSSLLFPGKICLDDSYKRLIIADTGHHRILLVNKQGVVEECIGGTQPGLTDGTFTEARFQSPQGVCYKPGGLIYVADTENHAIREIDLNKQLVITIAGTGKQGQDKEGGNIETEQAISSPWDVALTSSVDSTKLDILLIAMAGTHQIWFLFLEDGKWLKNSEYKEGTCIRWAGSGNEENRNNSYAQKAAFAQPSGLAVDYERQTVYVADSESSTIRTVSLKDGAVRALVGGERDPTNLFAYGDKDGKGVEAKLQHPLGVALLDKETGDIVVADSYNHKIKVINPGSKECMTILDQEINKSCLSEPGGLCVDLSTKLIYVADTNNHAIIYFDKEWGEVKQLPIRFPSTRDVTDLDSPHQFKRLTGKNASLIAEEGLNMGVNSTLILDLDLCFTDCTGLTEGAPSSWQAWVAGDELQHYSDDQLSGKLTDMSMQPRIKIKIPASWANQEAVIYVECMVYYCDDSGVCKMKGIVFRQTIKVLDVVSHAEVCLILQHELK